MLLLSSIVHNMPIDTESFVPSHGSNPKQNPEAAMRSPQGGKVPLGPMKSRYGVSGKGHSLEVKMTDLKCII